MRVDQSISSYKKVYYSTYMDWLFDAFVEKIYYPTYKDYSFYSFVWKGLLFYV